MLMHSRMILPTALSDDCLHPQGIKSLIAVPIFINGKLHGFLGIDNPP